VARPLHQPHSWRSLVDLADLFQQSERLWAENERVRRRLDDVLREARRSLGQHPDHQAAAPDPALDGSGQDRGNPCRQDASLKADHGD
jgi:hypothetical protein